MVRWKLLVMCLLLGITARAEVTAPALCAQSPAIPPANPEGMQYTVIQGDTVYFESLPGVTVSAKGKRGARRGAEWRKYYRLVYNFNKVYPYALVGRTLMAQVDSTIQNGGLEGKDRRSYVNQVERELLDMFEKDIREMTITQGYVLIRLVDRECGLSPYEIIQTYEGTFSAKFWQLVAKLFSHDLKTKYDPQGKDSQIEELVQVWDQGGWNDLYRGVFGVDPKPTVITNDRLSAPGRRRSHKE